MLRLHNLSKWQLLGAGKVLHLEPRPDARLVRLELNCPAPTRVDLLDDLGVMTFLAVVEGMEIIEFTVDGERHVDIVPTSTEDVWFFTTDGDQIAMEHDSASFTQIATRRARNPEVELMQFKMMQNIERRLASQREEFEELMERRREEDAQREAASAAAATEAAGEPEVPAGTAEADRTAEAAAA